MKKLFFFFLKKKKTTVSHNAIGSKSMTWTMYPFLLLCHHKLVIEGLY